MSLEAQVAELNAYVRERLESLNVSVFDLGKAVEKQNGRLGEMERQQAHDDGAQEARSADRRFMVQIVGLLLGAFTVATGLAAVLLRVGGS